MDLILCTVLLCLVMALDILKQFCPVSINQFKAEQMVDVVHTIKAMHSQRPGIVGSAVSCNVHAYACFRASLKLSTRG